MAQSYKALKENFVSNLSGGDLWEINYVTAVAPTAYLLWAALQSRQALFARYGFAATLTDFLLNVVAILLATTIYSPFPLALNASLALPALGLCLLPRASKKQRRLGKRPMANGKERAPDKDLEPLPVRPFITAYRGSMLVVTCLAILAVDFEVFPRRFAKAENWGTSLMDMGVGSFVFTAGLVAARPILKAKHDRTSTTFSQQVSASIKHALPLLVLGLVRLYSVKGLDYAEHVTEYGVHWNFFFTLALLPPSVALFDALVAVTPSVLASMSILMVGLYQALLESTDLKAYILTAPRTNLLSKNREGVFSFFGYLAIFLAGRALGLQILPRYVASPEPPNTFVQRKRLLIQLVVWSALWSLSFFVSTSYSYGVGLQVSRRLANLPYVVWVAAFNCAQITLFCIVETLLFPAVYKATHRASERKEVERATSWVLKAFNRNGLAVFLIANLLTGLINLTLDTLGMGQAESMGILLTYAGVITSLTLVLDHINLSIKI